MAFLAAQFYNQFLHELDKYGGRTGIIRSILSRKIRLVKMMDNGLQAIAGFHFENGNVCRMRPIHLFPSTKGWMRKTDSRIYNCGSAYVRHASVKLHLGVVFEILKALFVNKRNIFFYKLYDKGRNPILRAFWWSFAKIKVVHIIFRHNPMRCT